MKRNNTIWIVSLVLASLIFQGCLADLRTNMVKQEGITIENTEKGKALLDRAWKNQGFDQLKNHKVYSFKGQDTWKGMLARMGKIWPDMQSELKFKYKVGTFDGQVAFLDGKRNGERAGLQNWNYYEAIGEGSPVFKKTNPRINFGLAAFQYFTEMGDRLKDAPIISYAGVGEHRGKKYDLVFCTWNTAEPNKEADQYMAWIGKESGLIEFTQYTIRENFLKAPGGRAFYGGIEFSDFKEIDGVKIAHEQTVYVFDLKEMKKKNLHQLIISDFEFDKFDVADLQPDTSIELGGNFKN